MCQYHDLLHEYNELSYIRSKKAIFFSIADVLKLFALVEISLFLNGGGYPFTSMQEKREAETEQHALVSPIPFVDRTVEVLLETEID